MLYCLFYYITINLLWLLPKCEKLHSFIQIFVEIRYRKY